MQQEGHVVARHVEIAHVDLRGPRHFVQILQLWPIRIMDNFAVEFVADAENFIQWLALGKFDYGVVELSAADEVQYWALVQGLVRGSRHRRPYKGDTN